ncbi:MAG TPA: hypothetical protein G4O03_00335 [Dehalococcoidia bacterium]|nr:hypothetical protein [Dehalococcoidia bacterium]
MGEEIKSALERALERVEKLGEASLEEKKRWKLVPEGEALANRYLKGQSHLAAELAKYQAEDRKFIVAGAQDILLRHISLPKNDVARQANRQAMDGLKMIKDDKAGVENVFSKMRRIFEHYEEQGEQQRRQAYQNLRQDFEARVRQALQQQMGGVPVGFSINVERQPQFQEEWQRLLIQLDSQYLKLLDEYKKEIQGLP